MVLTDVPVAKGDVGVRGRQIGDALVAHQRGGQLRGEDFREFLPQLVC